MRDFIIKKLQLCIEINKSSDNEDYKQFLNDFIYNHLEKSIEQAIGDIDINTDDIISIQDPQVINIDNLKINQEDFYDQFTQKIYLDFSNKIQQAINNKNIDKISLVDYKKNIFIKYLQTGEKENNILCERDSINILYEDILHNEEAVKDVFIHINNNSTKRFFSVIDKNKIESTIKILYKNNFDNINNTIKDIIKIKKNIFADYYDDEIIKKNAYSYLLEYYGECTFCQDFFVVDVIKKLNKLTNISYEEIIYDTYHKTKNIYSKNNILINTVKLLYKDNYEKISISPFYNIEDEIKCIDPIIEEIKINNNKKTKQKLIYKISDIINIQIIDSVKIKIKNIILQKIKKINFEDCNVEVLINIYADNLCNSYLVFYNLFNAHKDLLNQNTFKFIFNNNTNEEKYIENFIDTILFPEKDLNHLVQIKKELSRFKDESSYEKIKKKINQVYNKKETQYIADITASNIAIAAASLKSLSLYDDEFKTVMEEEAHANDSIIAIEDKTEAKTDDICNEVTNVESLSPQAINISEDKISLSIDSLVDNSTPQIQSFDSKLTNAVAQGQVNDHQEVNNIQVTPEEEKKMSHDNEEEKKISHDNKEEKKISHDNEEKQKISHDNNDEDIIKSIVALILQKKLFVQQKNSYENIDKIKSDIIAEVLKISKHIVEDVINIFTQCQFGTAKDLTNYFFDSLKFSRDIDVSINFILITLKGNLELNDTILFSRIKNVIKNNDNNDACKILNNIININGQLTGGKICLDSYLDIVFYKELSRVIPAISENNIKNIFYYFNTPVNIFKFSDFVSNINHDLDANTRKKIVDIFIKNYIKKIKYKFSSVMSILHRNKFNYVDERYIEKLFLFIHEIRNVSSGNKHIDSFLYFCKKEISKTLTNVDIIKHLSVDNYKKIISIFPEIKNNFNFTFKVDSRNKKCDGIVNNIKNNTSEVLKNIKKMNNYDLFIFLNYIYLKKNESSFLEKIISVKKTKEVYKITTTVFEKLLQNKNINLKKIKAIIDYIFINQLKNIYFFNDIFEYIFQTIDLANIFYGIKLKQYFFIYKSEQEERHNDLLKNKIDKTYDLYIDTISEMLQTNDIKILSKLRDIEAVIKDHDTNKKHTKPLEIINDEKQKELLQEEHTERVCLEEKVKKIYIRNGGLVIMWPFFYGFFEKQHLLDEYNKKIFKNDIARHNAIHALQYLVSSKYESPDWKIILNKLLCGVRHDDVVSSGYVFSEKKTIDEAEQQLSQKELDFKISELRQNADSTINECISHWPEINNLSRTEDFTTGININNFRNYFLRRDAFLNIIEQKYYNGVEYNYILDISNKAYDEYVKTIPWNMHKISLPCMQKPIYVRNFDINSKQD